MQYGSAHSCPPTRLKSAFHFTTLRTPSGIDLETTAVATALALPVQPVRWQCVITEHLMREAQAHQQDLLSWLLCAGEITRWQEFRLLMVPATFAGLEKCGLRRLPAAILLGRISAFVGGASAANRR